jgi:23S rRNA pseudouridine1911/1915/1917 synthase
VRLIGEREVSRLYLALAERSWSKPARFDVREPMGRDPVNRLRMAVLPSGKPGVKAAHTAFKLLLKEGPLSLVACKLFTGRTHQIRVHLSWAGHPILADKVYGGHAGHGMVRQALHATRLAFTHPVSGESMSFHASPPTDMLQAMLDTGLNYNTQLLDTSVFS